MVCLSHKRTVSLVHQLSKDYNVKILFWADDLQKATNLFLYAVVCNIARNVLLHKMHSRPINTNSTSAFKTFFTIAQSFCCSPMVQLKGNVALARIISSSGWMHSIVCRV